MYPCHTALRQKCVKTVIAESVHTQKIALSYEVRHYSIP